MIAEETKDWFPNGLVSPSRVRQPLEVRVRRMSASYSREERITAAREAAEILTQYADLLEDSAEQEVVEADQGDTDA